MVLYSKDNSTILCELLSNTVSACNYPYYNNGCVSQYSSQLCWTKVQIHSITVIFKS